MKIFSVYDSKASAYIQPFFATTDAVAIRMFEEAISDPNHQFNKWAGDYTLFSLGEWDENTGSIFAFDTPYNLGTALTFKSQRQPAAITNGLEIQGVPNNEVA